MSYAERSATYPSWASNTEQNPDRIRELTQIIVRLVNNLFNDDFDTKVSAVGYRISNAWCAGDGAIRVYYIFQQQRI